MLRDLIVLVAAMAVVPPLAAAENGKLLIWINGDKGFNGLQQVADAFTKKTGIPAKVEHPDDLPKHFEEGAKNGSGPDVVLWAHDRLGDFINKGLIVEVTPAERLRKEVVSVGWDAMTVGGKTWGYPVGAEAIMLLYNRALVPKPPATFEEIEALDKQLAAKGIKAIGWDYTNTYFSWPLLAANGGYVFKREANGSYNVNDIGVDNSGALKGIDLIARFVANGVLPKGGLPYGDAEKAMTEGKQAMWINGPWAWASLRKANINFGVAPLPTVEGKPARPFVGVLGAMISAKSPNQDAAKRFLEDYLMTREGLQMINADKPIGVPLNKRLFWDLVTDENIRISMDGVTFGRAMPSAPEMGKFWGAMAEAFKGLAEAKKPPREFFDAAAKKIAAP